MKVIDIMQKVANKEIFKFRINDINYYVDKSNHICEEDGTKVEWYIDDEWLNMNAEIIEEDKNIRKLDFIEENTFSKRQNGMTSEDRRLLDSNFKEIGNKINEIIDKLNEMEK